GEQFLTTHVLVAGGDVAFADAVLFGPAGDGVFVEAHQTVLVADQVPGKRAAAEGIDLVPRQVAPPPADGVTRRTTSATTQAGKAGVFHLIQVKDTFQA